LPNNKSEQIKLKLNLLILSFIRNLIIPKELNVISHV
jgi:hypothetical protein